MTTKELIDKLKKYDEDMVINLIGVKLTEFKNQDNKVETIVVSPNKHLTNKS